MNTSPHQTDCSSWKDDKIKLPAEKHYQITTNMQWFLQLFRRHHAGWVCAEAFLKHLAELYLSFPHSSRITSASLCCRVRCCFLPLSNEHPDPCAGRPLRTNTIMQSLTTTCFLKHIFQTSLTIQKYSSIICTTDIDSEDLHFKTFRF